MSECIDSIKKATKKVAANPGDKECVTYLHKCTFEKLLIQMLFDGPDLTYSPSRFIHDDCFEEILHNNIISCVTETQKTIQLTLVSIYKSLNLSEKAVRNITHKLFEKVRHVLAEVQQKDDAVMSQVIDIQAFCNREITFLDKCIKRIGQNIEDVERVQFIDEIDLNICIQYWENSKSILVVESKKCSECKRLQDEETKAKELHKSRASFTSRLIRSISPTRRETKLEEAELKDMNHKHYKIHTIEDFITRFKSLPIFEKLCSIYESEQTEVSEAYKDFNTVLKRLIYDNKKLSTDYNMKELTQHIVGKYLKLSVLKYGFVGKADESMNSKLEKLRLIGYSSKLEVPPFMKESQVCLQCIKALEGISELETPTEKLHSLVTIVNSITTGFVFLSNSDEQASADNILHLI